MGSNDYFVSKEGALRFEDNPTNDRGGQPLPPEKNGKRIRKQLSRRSERLEYIRDSVWTRYRWNRAMRWTLAYLLLIAAFLNALLSTPPAPPIKAVHGFHALSVKPGSQPVFDSNGNIVSFEPTSESARTVFYDVPRETIHSDAMRSLAYTLYEIGNLGMMVADCSAYYSTGTSESVVSESGHMTLGFEIVDVRDNLSGEAFRQRYQFLTDSVGIGLIMSLFAPEVCERRYYKIGEPEVFYQHTKTFSERGKTRAPDWSKPAPLSQLGNRLTRTLTPIPYVSAAHKGGADAGNGTYGEREMYYTTAGEFYGGKYDSVFGDISSVRLPVYRDCYDLRSASADAPEGRLISYEKTDQHIFFDPAGDPFYNTIKSAFVEYKAAEGYYNVQMELDCSTGYASADTRWAVTDDQGSKDPNADFTVINVNFQLWDNGYFKQWNMYEEWVAPKAYEHFNMSAEQTYTEYFTYYAPDCDLTRFDFWSAA